MPIGHAGAPLFLPDADFAGEAAGLATKIASVAARARLAYELGSGENPFPDEPPVSTLNPRGKLGADLSGPPWGSALLHPIAWAAGRASSGNVENEKQQIQINSLGVDRTIGPWPIVNRQFEQLPHPRIAPYSRGYLSFTAHLSGATNTDIVVRLFSGYVYDETQARSSTVTINGGTTETQFIITDAWFDLVQGENMLWIVIHNDGDEDVIIDSLGIWQLAKRSH